MNSARESVYFMHMPNTKEGNNLNMVKFDIKFPHMYIN